MAHEWDQAKVSHGSLGYEQLITVHHIHLQLELIVSSLKWLSMPIDHACLDLIKQGHTFDQFRCLRKAVTKSKHLRSQRHCES